MIEKIFVIILCHLFGDYVLQCDFIAQTKGSNWYHLLVHCFLYVLPFYICFGFDWRIILLLITHIVIDSLKARYKKNQLHNRPNIALFTVFNIFGLTV